MIHLTPPAPDAEPELPRRVLVVSAHPDDVDFGASGTVARLTGAGVEVVYAIVSDGDAGEAPPDVPRPEVAALRQEEQRKAAAVVGVQDVRFLGFPDGALEAGLALREALARTIREVRPDVVICQSPERRWDRIIASHPDHLATGEATIAAVYPDSRNPYAFPDLAAAGLEPHVVREVWVMSHPSANRWVDITETLPAKVAALRSHASQTSHMDLEALVTGWGQAVARQGGLPDGHLAEAFLTCQTG